MRHPITLRNALIAGAIGILVVALINSTARGLLETMQAAALAMVAMGVFLCVLYWARRGPLNSSAASDLTAKASTTTRLAGDPRQVPPAARPQIILSGIVMPLVISTVVGLAVHSLIPALIVGALMSASGLAALVVMSRRSSAGRAGSLNR